MKREIPAFDLCLHKMLRCSRYAQRVTDAEAALIEELRSVYLDPVTRPFMLDALEPSAPRDDQGIGCALRRLRKRVLLRTLMRDINGLADLDEVVTVTSDLAEIAVQVALAHHAGALQEAHGRPIGATTGKPQELIVVGMGKLGGRELNVSSDIDLIFVYEEDGETDGAKPLPNREYFTKLGQRIIATVSETTPEGFVFRVDMRLRPFGDSGPLVVNFEGLEHYFVTSARPWERYAWLKARAIAGSATDLDLLVRPFVYRKYHDYGALQDLRELQAQIRAEATRKNKLDDIKVGSGGIREIEFIAQLFQLVRGGREARMQTRSTREAMTRIAQRALMPEQTMVRLSSAYVFLRNLEHRLQYLDDTQTQALPRTDADRAIIAEAMGFAGVEAFLAALERHRAFVAKEFDTLFASRVSASVTATKDDADSAQREWSPAWLDSMEIAEPLLRHLAGLGFLHARPIAERLCQWRQSTRYRFLTEKGRGKFERLIPVALEAAARHDRTPTTFFRTFDLLEAIDRRDAYLSLLIENPRVLDRVARLASRSAWAAELLKRHPILLDELLQADSASAAADWRIERAGLEHEVLAANADTAHQYDLLRHFKQVHTLRLNIADVDGSLPVMALADELSTLADLLLDVTLALAWRSLQDGAARGLEVPQGFAVIGYGKLGSKELGYASDLDLIFLYDERSAPNQEICVRLAQRLNQWLNAVTSGGVLYETDLRLRPDGVSGLLVTSLAAFREYQLTRAWTWEHQALTRARFCAGDPGLAASFDAIRAEILTAPRDLAKLREEILAMRAKMRAEHPDRSGERLDLKQTRGGIIDLEFIVQYLVLAHAARHREMVRNAGNFALLEMAGKFRLVEEKDADAAARAYLIFRARQHLARNNNEHTTLIEKDELRLEREAVARAWDAVFAGGTEAS